MSPTFDPGPRSIATPGEGGPWSRCELGEGGIWKTGSKGRTLFVPSAKKKTGGEPDLPNSFVKLLFQRLQTPCGAGGGPGPWSPIKKGGGGLGNRLEGGPSPGVKLSFIFAHDGHFGLEGGGPGGGGGLLLRCTAILVLPWGWGWGWGGLEMSDHPRSSVLLAEQAACLFVHEDLFSGRQPVPLLARLYFVWNA